MTTVEPMNADRLTAIRELEQVATKGPWHVERHEPTLTRLVVSDDYTLDISFGYLGNRTEEDAEFVAHSREDIPDLLAEVERLRAELLAAQSTILAVELSARGPARTIADRIGDVVRGYHDARGDTPWVTEMPAAFQAIPDDQHVVTAWQTGDRIHSLDLKVGDEVDVTLHGVTLYSATRHSVTVENDDLYVEIPLSMTGLTIEPLPEWPGHPDGGGSRALSFDHVRGIVRAFEDGDLDPVDALKQISRLCTDGGKAS